MHIFDYYFSVKDKKRIVESIKAAELETSGEIRVYFERQMKGDTPKERAISGFYKLGMHKTKDRNGVLFYIAFEDRQFAIIGDKGIHEHVKQEFWDSTSDTLRHYLKKGDITTGLVEAIEEVGKRLKQYFPYQRDDKNELTDDIHFEKD